MFESPFHWWVQSVMPVVFDESLSYYEVLAKLTKYIEGLSGDVKEIEAVLDTIEGIGDIEQFTRFLESIQAQIGNLANLETVNKNTLVSAINEVAEIASNAYVKPLLGIPESDLSLEVREKLNAGGGGGSAYTINGVLLKPYPLNNTASELGLGTYNLPDNGIPWTDLSQDVQERIDAGGGGGTTNYAALDNKPQINGHVLNAGNNGSKYLGLGTYSVPEGGIPESDLSRDVVNKLNTSSSIADENEGTIAQRDYESGELVYINGVLYKTTMKVLTGSNFIVGTNIVATDINEELERINTEIERIGSGQGLDSWSLSADVIAGVAMTERTQNIFEYINLIGNEAYNFVVTPTDNIAYCGTYTISVKKRSDGTVIDTRTINSNGIYLVQRYTVTPDETGDAFVEFYNASQGSIRYRVTIEYTQSQGISELWNQINVGSDTIDAVDALELLTETQGNAIDNIKTSLATEYDNTATYDFGDYVMHNDKLYTCVSPINTPEEWTSEHWALANVASEIDGVKDANLAEMHNIFTISQEDKLSNITGGGISPDSGQAQTNAKRARTNYENALGESPFLFEVTDSNYIIDTAWFFSSASNTAGTRAIPINIDARRFVCKPASNEGYFRVAFKKVDNSNLSSSDYTAIKNSIKWSQCIDRTLSLNGVAANAKTTGDRIDQISNAINYQNEKEQLTNTWESGGITASGSTTTSANRIRFVSYMKVDVGMEVILPEGMQVSAYIYSSNSASTFIERTEYTNKSITYYYPGKYIKLVAGYTAGGNISASAGDDIIRYNIISTSNKLAEEFEKDVCIVDEDYGLEQGAIKSADGTQQSNNTRVRTISYIPIHRKLKFTVPTNMKLKIAYYNTQSAAGYIKMLPATSWATGDVTINTDDGEYCRLVIAFSNDANITPAMVYNEKITLEHYYGSEYINKELIFDAPKSLGALNCVKNAKQLYSILFDLEATLPNQSGDLPAGITERGIPYSSTRYENLYVPNCVSFDSFMTALKNPNSYIYTRVVTAADGTTRLENSKTYYASVCSSFVCYCLGINGVIYTTHQLGELPGMTRLEEQNCYALEVGDLLLKTDDHIALVTGIGRNKSGEIERVEVIDSFPPFVRKRLLTPARMNTLYFSNSAGYKAYRYSGIKNTPYVATPWVHLNGETGEPVYNANICPRRGDKSVWPVGETVEIDILDAGDYTDYKLYKNETLVSSESIVGSVITLEDLAYGNYKLCLTDGSNVSDYVYWIVVDEPQISAEYTANKTVTATFSCANAEATSIAWCRDCPTNLRHWYAAYDCTLLSDAEKLAGEVVNTYSGSDWSTITAADSGKWYIRFMWKTDYGYYSAKYVEINTN